MSEKNAQLYVDNDGTIRREGLAEPEDNNCTGCQKKQACISFFAHENAMMHKDLDNERLHATMKDNDEKNARNHRNTCITFIVIILLFVVTYTIRTNIWNETVRQMSAAIVELANAKGIIAP